MRLILFTLLFLFNTVHASNPGSVSASMVKLSPLSLPAICDPGDVRFNSVTAELAVCNIANTWQQIFDAANLTGTIPPGTLPVATTGAVGVVFASNATANNFVTGITSGTGAITRAQPSFSNLSGSITVSQMNSGTGASTSTFWRGDGTWAAGGLPLTTLGDTVYEDATPLPVRLPGNTTTTKKFLQQTGNGTISAAPAWGQPAFTDITGSVAAAQLPNPSSSTLGGVQSAAAVTNQWINSISTSGVPALSQPAFSNLSGNIGVSQMNSGTSASSSTFWRGDGTWAIAGGTITGPGSSTNTAIARWNSTTGTALLDSTVTIDSSGNIATSGDTTSVKITSATDPTSALSMAYAQSNTRAEIKTLQTSTNQGAGLFLGTADVAGSNASSTGSVVIGSGSKTAGTGNSGDVTLQPGTSAGGQRGRIDLVDSTEGFAGSMWTSNNNAGGGHWVAPPAGRNYVPNPDAEFAGTPGWANYANAAGVVPVNGTGGSPVTAIARTSTGGEILRGGASFKWAKSAANRQGEGFSFDIAVDPAEKLVSTSIPVSFDYFTSSGYASGDMQVFVYDIANSTLLSVFDPDGLNGALVANTTFRRFTGRFFTTAGSGSYRVIVHTATTSAVAYNLFTDNWVVGGGQLVPGFVGTPTVSFTPTLLNAWTNTTLTGNWYRVGEYMVITYKLQTTGTPTGTSLSFNMVPGYTVDNNKLLSVGDGMKVGIGGFYQTGIVDGSLEAFINYNAGSSYFNASYINSVTSGATTQVSPTAPVAFSNHPDYIWLTVRVPIVGWDVGATFSSSSVLLQTPIPTAATSSVKTPTASGNFNLMTGNSLTLTPGKWRLSGSCGFANSGTTPTYTQFDCLWLGANGADSVTAPALMTAVTGLTILSTGQTENFINLGSGNVASYYSPAPSVVVQCTAPTCVIYLDTYAIATTIANARITAYPTAEKIPDFSVFSIFGGIGSVGSQTNFTSSGTFTTPVDSSTKTVYRYWVIGAGGGGGGSNGASSAGGGAGAGGSSIGTFTGVAGNTAITITVSSSGGTAGAGTGGTGGTGGTSSIGSPVSVSCTGGVGGVGSTTGAVAGGAGGTCSGGGINMAGQAGSRAPSTSLGGQGASSNILGTGGFPGMPGSGGGVSATGFGAGGGGAIATTAGGGSGAPGLVIIWQDTP